MIELGVECFYSEEIEKCPCNDVEELQKRERHYILERKPVLNIQIPMRTTEEWRRDSQEHLQEYERQRHINNPRKEYRKQYRENNKEKLDENSKRFREGSSPEEEPKQRKRRNKKGDMALGGGDEADDEDDEPINRNTKRKSLVNAGKLLQEEVLADIVELKNIKIISIII